VQVRASTRPQPRGVTGSAALTAASLLASMGLGAVLAVLVLLLFGKDVRTDAFFAAYGVFAVLNALGQSLRITVVPRLVEAGDGHAALDRFLGAVLLMVAGAGVVLVLLGGPLAALLVSSLGPEAERITRVALVLLWIAGSLQLVAGLLAGALGARGRFGPPAVAYVTASFTAIVALVALAGPFGIQAVSGGIALASTVTSGLLLRALWSDGYRPALARLRPSAATLRALGQVLPGSLPYVVVQVTYVISLGYAARLGEGEVTLYSYAFFAALLVVGATGGPASMVLAAPLAQSWDRDPRSLIPHLAAVTRAGLILGAPMIAGVAFVGDEILDVLLGSAVTAEEGDRVVGSVLALSGFVVATLANSVPMVASFVALRYAAVAALSALGVVAHVALTAAAAPLGGLEGIGLAASASALFFLACLVVLVWGRRRAGAPAWLLVRETMQIAAAALGGFGAAWWLAAALGGGAWQLAALALGAVLFLVLLRVLLPAPWAVARQLGTALARGARGALSRA
jgi:peptidoglycan biosynthesis protein MviN/MurJ (putative lipid II flippase)